ncbi:hypothetical protein NDU88_008522 [Pleurodeles waltl]|uniref:Uncharacterized protein n=1 Tax=Pleurodeles waltl TaxID=8319 RepID=A0AAV7PRU1_PLEWA|nr:hypothetical protein NDU88_008522 [Pleurodeles waltl]
MLRRRAGGAPRALESAGSCSAWPPLGARAEAPEWGTRGAPPDRKYAGGPGGHWDRAPHAEPRGLRGRRRLGGEALRREGGPGVPTQRRSTRRLCGNPPDGGRTGNPGEHWGAKSHRLEEATPPRPKKRGPAPAGLPPGAQLNCRWRGPTEPH